MKQVPYRLAEALEHICKRKSLENITVSQIAAEAGITRQVFYHYFDDKFELAYWIHHMHLYQSVKAALEEDVQQVWKLTTTHWMECLVQNKDFYMNAFQSLSQREFQRIIRNFYLGSYKWQMEQQMGRALKEEELFALRTYLYGGMEAIYEWIASGMIMPVDRMVELLRLSMPEPVAVGILNGNGVAYLEAVKVMEQYLFEEGLLQTLS